ncbi:chorismate synthase [Peptococcaceae bacterium SCADC1_2_3]|nr:chorismate synthase [Peptococcaceae bacterium SCADC1_2_3]KFI35571.1 chorismate synthase [Peptococcaceae bacterium SCADC1_2_3]HCJ78760.1 chorismate synthase [Desulfotomaculum sp.]
MLRYLTAGESHGPVLTAIIEGLPAGLAISEEYINQQLARRQGGYGRGGRMQIERDQVKFLSGVRGGFTLGNPVTLQIENRDWVNWQEVMTAGLEARLTQRVVTKPRPGHADLAGALKYDHQDIRNVLERASARDTAARVAVGSITRRLLEELGVEIVGQVVRIGPVALPEKNRLEESGNLELPIKNEADKAGQQAARIKKFNLWLKGLRETLAGSPTLCLDRETGLAMQKEIDLARAKGDSLGGVFEIHAFGLPPGLGSYAQWDRRLDTRLAAALMSVQAIKGVEIGAGFACAALGGSAVHDEIFFSPDRGFYRLTNNAGGLEGGVTNGEPIVLRAAMKPIPTLNTPLRSVDLVSKEPFAAAVERADVCAVPAACVVGEAVVAWELAVACLEKFGGDSLNELKANWENYLAYLEVRGWKLESNS